MCRWIAYHGEPLPLEDLIFKPSHSLVDQSYGCREGATRSNGDGYGVGWYGAGERPGLFRQALPAWYDRNLCHLARHIVSPLVFAHVRASTGTAISRDNCHPFAQGAWMFMHNGQVGNYEKCRPALESLLDEDLAVARQGTTDSELFFLLMLRNGLKRDPLAALRATIDQITDVAAACGSEEPLKLTVCFSDGEVIFACRHASEGPPPSLYWQVHAGGVVVASEPSDCGRHPWNEVAADSILTVGTDIAIQPLRPAAVQSPPCRIVPMPDARRRHVAA